MAGMLGLATQPAGYGFIFVPNYFGTVQSPPAYGGIGVDKKACSAQISKSFTQFYAFLCETIEL